MTDYVAMHNAYEERVNDLEDALKEARQHRTILNVAATIQWCNIPDGHYAVFEWDGHSQWVLIHSLNAHKILANADVVNGYNLSERLVWDAERSLFDEYGLPLPNFEGRVAVPVDAVHHEVDTILTRPAS